MRRICVIALIVIAACACDAPWDGPALPAGAHWIDYRSLGTGPSSCAIKKPLIAGTNIEEIRAEVDSVCRGQSWLGVAAADAGAYVAVYAGYSECGETEKNAMATGPATIYFIHWLGRSSARCGEAAPAASFRLYAVASKDVPPARTVTVELLDQSPTHPTDRFTVDLG